MCSVLYLYDIHKFCSQQLLDVQVKSSLLLVGDFELPSEVEFDYSEVKKKKEDIYTFKNWFCNARSYCLLL